jgi:hypothetical protein
MNGLTELKELQAQLVKPQLEDDELFYRLVSRCMELAEIGDAELAKELRVSRPTVTRWRNRKALAHTALRPTIYEFLKKHVDHAVRLLEKHSGGGGQYNHYYAAAAKGGH